MKKTLAWIATLALLLTSMSSLAAISASAEGTKVLCDFDSINEVTFSAANGAVENGQWKVAASSTTENLFKVEGKEGDFDGDSISFTYLVDNVTGSSDAAGVIASQLYVFYADGTTFKRTSGQTTNTGVYTLLVQQKLGNVGVSATHTIDFKKLKETYADWSALDTSKIVRVVLQGNRTSATTSTPNIYIDNIVLNNPKAAEELPTKLLTNFDNVQNVGDATAVTSPMTAALVGDTNKQVNFSSPAQSSQQYPYFGFRAPQGAFAGEGIQFKVTNNLAEALVSIAYVRISYYDAADSNKAKNYNLYDWSKHGYKTLAFTEGVYKIMYDTLGEIDEEIINSAYAVSFGFVTKAEISITVDDVYVVEPCDIEAPTATLSLEPTEEGNIKVNASATDNEDAEPSVSVYFSAEELNASNVEEKIASGAASPLVGTEATGLTKGQQYWFAAQATDASGNASDYVFANATTLNLKLLTNFDNAQDVGDAAYVRNGMDYKLEGTTDKEVEFTCVQNTSAYPYFGIKGDVGALTGSGIRFTVQNTGTNLPGVEFIVLDYVDADGKNQTYSLYNWGNHNYSRIALKEGTNVFTYNKWGEVDQAILKNVWGIRFGFQAKEAYSFTVDNVYVADPIDVTPPAISLSAQEADQTVTLTTELGDAATSQLYWSESEITKENIESANVMQGKVLSDLKSGTTYYFALKAADEAGNVAYAFTSVKTTSKKVVIYDADEHSGTGTGGNNAIVSVVNGVEGATGNVYQAQIVRAQYPAIDFMGNAGDFLSNGFSLKLRAEITADEGKEAPQVIINGVTVFYDEEVEIVEGKLVTNSYDWTGGSIPSDGTWKEWTYTNFYDEDDKVTITKELLAKVKTIRINLEIKNHGNGDIVLYFDDFALIDPPVVTSSVEEKLGEGASIFDLSNAEMNVAREEGLLTNYAPTMNGATLYAKDGKFRGELGFIVTNPDQLDADMAANGYIFKTMGVLVMPQALVDGRTLVRGMADVLDITADYVADGEDYSTYTALLGNSTDYALYQMCARAYAVYENADGQQITVYSDNDAAEYGVADGVVTRSLNNVTRSFAKKCFDGTYGYAYKVLTVDGVQKPLKEDLNWDTKGTFAQAWAYAKEAYLYLYQNEYI